MQPTTKNKSARHMGGELSGTGPRCVPGLGLTQEGIMFAGLEAGSLAPEKPETITAAEAVNQIATQLMVRGGERIDIELALERARNIVAGLQGLVIR